MRRIKDDPNINHTDLKRELRFVAIIGTLLLIYLLIWSVKYTFLDSLAIVGLAFFILVPSFLANAMMVITGKIKGIKRYPIDGGKKFIDGKRIFGEGKSWNGFIGGWITGFALSAVICWIFFRLIRNATNYDIVEFINLTYIHNFIEAGLNTRSYILSQLFIALGSPIGDLLGSFFKRRVSRGRGEVFLFWDQNDFIIVSAAIACIWYPLTWQYWISLLLLTPLMTAFANWVGYQMNKKDVPW